MHAQYGDQANFVGVAGRDDSQAARDFLAAYSVDAFPHAFDRDGSVWATFGVRSQPAWAFIDADGDTEVVIGRLGEDRLRQRLDALLMR